MLSKQRNRFLIHKRGDLRLYLTKSCPTISKLCEGRQAHPPHWTGDLVCIDFFKIKFFKNTTSCLLDRAWGRQPCRGWKGGDGTTKFATDCSINQM